MDDATRNYVGVVDTELNHSVFVRNKRIRQINEFIQSHLSERLTLSRLAAYVGCSPNHLSHYFHEKTGVQLTRWIAEVRIRYAQARIESTDTPIQEIARDAGFTSESSFRRYFLDIVGMSARDYRKAAEQASKQPV